MEIISERICNNNKITEYADGTGKITQISFEDDFFGTEEIPQVVEDIDKIELSEKIDYLTTLVEIQGGLI